MITKKEQEIIRECAMKYKVSSVLLFGSSVNQKDANDIDLAVSGVKAGLFFKFYGELYRYLSKPVDLVDLDDAEGYFKKCILEEGKVIYEA